MSLPLIRSFASTQALRVITCAFILVGCDGSTQDISDTEVEQGAVLRLAMTGGTDVTSFDIAVSKVACEGEQSRAATVVGRTEMTVVESDTAATTNDGAASGATLPVQGETDVALDVGCYEARALPLGHSGEYSQVCLPTMSPRFEVEDQILTDVVLVAKCLNTHE